MVEKSNACISFALLSSLFHQRLYYQLAHIFNKFTIYKSPFNFKCMTLLMFVIHAQLNTPILDQ